MNINLSKRRGFKNRHIDGVPKHQCKMKVITNDVNGENVFLCEWNPFDKSKFNEYNMPGKGYLGTVKIIEGTYKGLGFHAWKQNNSEFIWYSEL